MSFYHTLRNKIFNYLYNREGSKEHKRRQRDLSIGVASKRGIKKDVIFIVIDCLRADHLSCSSYHRQTTPFLDSLVNRSWFFPHHYTVAPWTYPSILSLLTGLTPDNHGGRIVSEEMRHFNVKDLPNRCQAPTLVDILEKLSYQSYYFSSIITADLSFKGVFQSSDCQSKHSAEELIKRCRIELKSALKQNKLIYLQLGDLHEPIEIPSFYLKKWEGVDQQINNIKKWAYHFQGEYKRSGFPLYKFNRIKLYDAALNYIDNQIKYFFTFLQEEGLLEKTIVVITSDHGEEFWDHVGIEEKLFQDPRHICGVGHGHSLFQELMRVPLIIVDPEKQGKKEKGISASIDVVPTLLDLMGIETDCVFDGIPLTKGCSERVLTSGDLSYGFEQKAAMIYPWKIIECKALQWKLVYNLQKDPQEQQNLYFKGRNKIVARLDQELQQKWTGNDRGKTTLPDKLEKITKKRLEKLGYM